MGGICPKVIYRSRETPKNVGLWYEPPHGIHILWITTASKETDTMQRRDSACGYIQRMAVPVGFTSDVFVVLLFFACQDLEQFSHSAVVG
jgi:hypothetical protein